MQPCADHSHTETLKLRNVLIGSSRGKRACTNSNSQLGSINKENSTMPENEKINIFESTHNLQTWSDVQLVGSTATNYRLSSPNNFLTTNPYFWQWKAQDNESRPLGTFQGNKSSFSYAADEPVSITKKCLSKISLNYLSLETMISSNVFISKAGDVIFSWKNSLNPLQRAQNDDPINAHFESSETDQL